MTYKHTLILDNHLGVNSRVDIEFEASDNEVDGIYTLESTSHLNSDDLFNLQEWLEQDAKDWELVRPFAL